MEAVIVLVKRDWWKRDRRGGGMSWVGLELCLI